MKTIPLREQKKEFFTSVFKTVIDGIILIDTRGVIRDINPSALQYFGYDYDELLGQNINALMSEPDHSAHQGYIERYLHTGVGHIIEKGRQVSGKRKDGSSFPFRLAVSEFELDGEKFFTGIIHDLSEEVRAKEALKEHAETLERQVKERTHDLEDANRQLQKEIRSKKRSDQALQESQKLYKRIAQNFPNGTINVFDTDLNYVFVEGKGLLEMGIETEDLIGSSFIERIDEDLRETVREKLLQVFEGNPTNFEINTKGNVYFMRAEPLFKVSGEVEQILVVETNITQRKRAEEEMARALAKEIELNELKSRFVSMASHEFRTPLSAILSSATLISKYTEGEQQEKRTKHVNRIQSNVENLNSILEDFLSLEKLNAGKLTFNPVQIELAPFVKECIEETEGILKSGQSVDLQVSGKARPVMLDKVVFKNILVNLLSNASKYSPEHSPIEVRIEFRPQSIDLEVQDHGIGIPESDQAKLFGRFYRASNAGNIQGTGLGLHIVKSYVDLIGGSIRCESVEGEGTCMKLKLALKSENEESSHN